MTSNVFPDAACGTPVFTPGWTVQHPEIPVPSVQTGLAPVQWAFINNSTLPAGSPQPLEDVIYDNGPDGDGVGATLTSSKNGILKIDGGSPAAGDHVLVIGPTGGTESAIDGIYTVTNTGSTRGPWLLTRSEDHDSPDTLGRPWSVDIQGGNVWAGATVSSPGVGPEQFQVGATYVPVGISMQRGFYQA